MLRGGQHFSLVPVWSFGFSLRLKRSFASDLWRGTSQSGLGGHLVIFAVQLLSAGHLYNFLSLLGLTLKIEMWSLLGSDQEPVNNISLKQPDKKSTWSRIVSVEKSSENHEDIPFCCHQPTWFRNDLPPMELEEIRGRFDLAQLFVQFESAIGGQEHWALRGQQLCSLLLERPLTACPSVEHPPRAKDRLNLPPLPKIQTTSAPLKFQQLCCTCCLKFQVVLHE